MKNPKAKPVKQACAAIKPDGSPCSATPQQGKIFCFFHDPKKAEERRDAQVRGGEGNRALPLPIDAPDFNAETVADLRPLFLATINRYAGASLVLTPPRPFAISRVVSSRRSRSVTCDSGCVISRSCWRNRMRKKSYSIPIRSNRWTPKTKRESKRWKRHCCPENFLSRISAVSSSPRPSTSTFSTYSQSRSGVGSRLSCLISNSEQAKQASPGTQSHPQAVPSLSSASGILRAS